MEQCLVYLSVFNGAAFVRETLDSVLAQDYPAFELILTDDCSTDDSASILRDYAARFPDKIRLRENRVNQGVGRTLFQSFREYHDAAYFAMIGHDDVWDRHYLSAQIAFIRETGCVAAFAAYRYVDGDGNGIRRSIFENETLNALSRETLFIRLLRGNFLLAASGVADMRGIGWQTFGTFFGYDSDRLQDYELWLNLALRGEMRFHADTAVRYRVLAGSMGDNARHILEEKYECCGAIRRALFSPAFLPFLQGARDPAALADAIIKALGDRAEESELFLLLLMDFAQMLLSAGLGAQTVEEALRRAYFQSGLLAKSIHGYGALPQKITVAATPGCRPLAQRLVAGSADLAWSDGEAEAMVCLPEECGETAAVTVVLAAGERCARLREEMPNALVLSMDGLTPQAFRGALLLYMEDCALPQSTGLSARLLQGELTRLKRSEPYRLGRKLCALADRVGVSKRLKAIRRKRNGGMGQ